jgi:hypothetical protein
MHVFALVALSGAALVHGAVLDRILPTAGGGGSTVEEEADRPEEDARGARIVEEADPPEEDSGGAVEEAVGKVRP